MPFDNNRRPRPGRPAPQQPRQTPTPLPATPPGKVSPFYSFLAALDKVSQVKKKVVIFDTFEPKCFEQEDVRVDNHFDPTRSPFFSGRVRSYTEKSGYGFLMASVPGVAQEQFFIHASGFEQPTISVVPPSEFQPFTVIQVGGMKMGRAAKEQQMVKGEMKDVQFHILPLIPQRDDPIAFAVWDDPRKGNKCAGRWLFEWMFNRIPEAIAILTSRSADLMRKYKVVLLEDGKETELFRTNYPMQAVAGYARIQSMLGEGQELFLQDCVSQNPIDPADIRWDSHPMSQFAIKLNHYLANKAEQLPV